MITTRMALKLVRQPLGMFLVRAQVYRRQHASSNTISLVIVAIRNKPPIYPDSQYAETFQLSPQSLPEIPILDRLFIHRQPSVLAPSPYPRFSVPFSASHTSGDVFGLCLHYEVSYNTLMSFFVLRAAAEPSLGANSPRDFETCQRSVKLRARTGKSAVGQEALSVIWILRTKVHADG